ncbi:YxiJ-like family protein [Priestia megaterium]|uniref:YxiJ-like family protein n=1 Tax=Priestia megaterium TaxID=1404 RepID=UPI0021D64BC6|nr:YxiJ-like family protein [Priestia megaterium]MCU7766545.1 YxiJ-like family protein [Priestia megaterium]
MKLINDLKQLEVELYHPFPYDDVDKMKNEFNEKFREDDVLTADLDSYWANIAGSLSYVLKGKTKKIPQHQINELRLTFFEVFPQYSFLEKEIFRYPTFYEEYKIYEKTRLFMLSYLFNTSQQKKR